MPESRLSRVVEDARGSDLVTQGDRLRGIGDLRAQVEVAKPRVALAGQDQRKRDRPIEQVGAALLAGPLLGARDVEYVVEVVEGQVKLKALVKL